LPDARESNRSEDGPSNEHHYERCHVLLLRASTEKNLRYLGARGNPTGIAKGQFLLPT
jgi:hypothetical protein